MEKNLRIDLFSPSFNFPCIFLHFLFPPSSPPLLPGVLCDPAHRGAHGQRPAAHHRPGPTDGVRPDGWPRRLPDAGARQAPGVQLAAALQVELHVHAGGAAQPEPGPLRVHLQRVQAPRGDTLPLHRVRGERGAGGRVLHACHVLALCRPVTGLRWWLMSDDDFFLI